MYPPREVRSPWPCPPSCPPQELGHYGIEGTLTSPTMAQLEPPPGLPPGWGAGAGFFPCPLVASWLVMRGHSCPLSQNLEGAGQSTLATGTAPPRPPPSKALVGKPGPPRAPHANRAHPQGEGDPALPWLEWGPGSAPGPCLSVVLVPARRGRGLPETNLIVTSLPSPPRQNLSP